MTSKKLETAAKLYLVASRMNTDLVMATMRTVFGHESCADIAGAVDTARKKLQRTATGPRRLAESALVQLVRHDGSAETARVNMTRRHPCNTPGQTERAIFRAYSRLDGYETDHMGIIMSWPGFYQDRIFGDGAGGAGPAWSAALARICDVGEETGSPHGYCGRAPERTLHDGDTRGQLLMPAMTYLIRHDGCDDAVRKTLEHYEVFDPHGVRAPGDHDTAGRSRYYRKVAPGDIDWAIAEGRRRLREKAARAGLPAMTRFAWIQMVCGVFGRRDIRGWMAQEYPCADDIMTDRAMQQAAGRLASDIRSAGPEVAAPGAMYLYSIAGRDEKAAKKEAEERWWYLEEGMVDRIFEGLCAIG